MTTTDSPTAARFPLLVRALMREIFARALETPSEVADIFVEFSAHVNRVHVRGYAGGWRRDAAADFDFDIATDFADTTRANQEAEKALALLEGFIAVAPEIAAKRRADTKAEASRERAEFAAAVGAFAAAKEQGADEATLQRLATTCDIILGGMKYGAGGGLWWDERHGTWGTGTLTEEDHEALDRGACIAGPHA